MKYWLLVLAGLRRKPVRTVLTAVAVMVAFLLFGVMHGVVAGFDGALDRMSDTRLRVMSRASMLESLPLAHGQRIRTVDGVTEVSHATIFGGMFQDGATALSSAAVDVATFARVFDGLMEIPDDQMENVLAVRTGAIVGVKLAERFGWQIGDKIPLQSFIWTQEDGSRTWTFDILAIATPVEDEDELFGSEIYFHHEYLDEARVQAKGTTSQFIVAIEDADDGDRIVSEIDALFANSAYETTTMNDKQYLRAQLQQAGDLQVFVNSILAAVLFTLLFLTGTTIMQSMRERIPELGVLKSLGYTDSSLFLVIVAEALVLCGLGAGLGLLLAGTVFPSIFGTLGLASVPLGDDVYVTGLLISVGLAVLVSLWPAWRARTLTIAAAVSGR